MNENNERRKRYNPKFTHEDDPWDPDCWQTGSMEPPRNRGGVMALLLILIIFLCGIITVLGILNVRLFTQLQNREEGTMSISFSTEPAAQAPGLPAPAMAEAAAEATEPTEEMSMELHECPPSVENYPQEDGLSLQAIYEKNIGSVVSILCQLHGGSSTGTGVVLSDSGYIVTNAHVVDDALSVSVQLSDNRLFQASLVGSDSVSDLAVLYIDADGLIPAEFGDSTTVRVGDSVAAIGDPLGVEFRGSFTDGIISAINRDVTVNGRTLNLLQTNAALNSGNSGGPLINCFGQVIGINTMKIGAFTNHAGVEGLGFAIPSATVKDVVEQLIDQGYVSGRPTLGLTVEMLSTFYQHYYRLPAGLYITHVEEDSYAAYYGVEPGDILIGLDDTRITDVDGLNAVLYAHNVGDVVTATFYRNGQQARIDLTLTESRGE